MLFQAHSFPKNGDPDAGEQLFLTRPKTFPQLAELDVWDPPKI